MVMQYTDHWQFKAVAVCAASWGTTVPGAPARLVVYQFLCQITFCV